METDESSEQKLAEIRKKILKYEREKNQKKNAQRKKTRPQYQRNHNKNTRARHNKYTFNNKQRHAYSRNMNVHIIESVEETDKIISRLLYTDCVGFDCEGIITLGRTGKLSLIQISTEHHIYLFDILKMDYKIPKSLSEWLSSDKCTKFIHDSRQDQDALYHCYGIELNGIFDTTIADLIGRVWLSKVRSLHRLKGMDSLANDTIHKVKDYKVLFSIQSQNTGKYIKLCDLHSKEKGKNNSKNSSVKHHENPNEKKWKKIKVNCFDQKQNIKAMMRKDACLWAKRPIPINLVIYAAVDGYVSLLMGQYFRRKFKQWMIDKALFVSSKWCRMVARQTRVRKSSARVPNSIVKLIRSDTSQMKLKSIPNIDTKFKYKREREKEEKGKQEDQEDQDDGVEVEFDNLLLMIPSIDFVAIKLKSKMNPNLENHEDGIMEHMTDVYKLNYDAQDQSAYVRIGKLNYNRLIPLKLINAEKDNL